MSTPILTSDQDGAVLTLTLNTPGSLNALSTGMLATLQTTFDGLMTDRSVRAVILRGAGKAFRSGHDLREMT
ncbi:MAG: enoyl-CoA hydratase-related protein, partial [Pseudomonadota bacterium]